MKIAIRRGVFETNSSSTHSVSIIGRDKDTHTIELNDVPEIDSLVVDERYNKVLSHFGEFGWGPEVYNSPAVKLSYLLTMVAMTEAKYIKSSNEYFNTEGFKTINDAVANRCNCDGVFIDDDIKISSYKTNPSITWIDIDGYIDHQSYNIDWSLADFLSSYDVTAEEFIFDKNCILFISNDNAYDDEYDRLFKTHINKEITDEEYYRDILDHQDLFDEYDIERAKEYFGIKDEEDEEDEIEAEEDY